MLDVSIVFVTHRPERRFEWFVERWNNQSMVFDLLHGNRPIRSVGNVFDLATLRPRTLEAAVARYPREYWFGGAPVAEL